MHHSIYSHQADPQAFCQYLGFPGLGHLIIDCYTHREHLTTSDLFENKKLPQGGFYWKETCYPHPQV